MVMVNGQGVPVRAMYGGLPGALQTVGRAERHAAWQALRAAGGVKTIVTDLMGLATEAGTWNEQLAKASGKHATIWRSIFWDVVRHHRDPPAFRWTPAHLTMKEALDRDLRITDWLGNQWADVFAKLGASQIKVEDHVVKETKARLADAIDRAKYVAYISITKKWGDLDEQGTNIIIPQPPKQQVPRLVSFVGHTYIDRPSGGVMCARCGR